MTECPLAELNKSIHLGIVVVDTVNHGVFICGPTASLFDIELDCFVKTRQSELFNTGHQLVARRLNGRVQGDGEGELLGKVCKATDSGNNTAGGNGKMACSDSEALRVVKGAKRFENVIKIIEGFTLPHKDDAGHALTKVLRDVKNLVDNLAGCKGASEAGESSCAKGATHSASSLG